MKVRDKDVPTGGCIDELASFTDEHYNYILRRLQMVDETKDTEETVDMDEQKSTELEESDDNIDEDTDDDDDDSIDEDEESDGLED